MMMADALEAQRLLGERYEVRADVWSATSYKLLREDALDCERWNRMHPLEHPRAAYVTRQLAEGSGPVVAVTDYLSLVPDQIARFVPTPFVALGTDGYGLSDTRAALRRHFEVDSATHRAGGARRARDGRGRHRPEGGRRGVTRTWRSTRRRSAADPVPAGVPPAARQAPRRL